MRRTFQLALSISCVAAAITAANTGCAQAVDQAGVSPQVQAESISLPTFHSGWFGLSDGVLKGSANSISDAGEPVVAPGAKVTLLEISGNSRETVADDSGLFTFSGVKPGSYRLEIDSAEGCSAFAFKTITLLPGDEYVAKAYISSMPRKMVEESMASMWSPDLKATNRAAIGSQLIPRSLSSQSPRVAMRNGLVYGEISFENGRAIPGNHVIKVFDRDGGLVATERVDSLGKFSFAPKSAGVFNVLVGGAFHACIPVVVVAEEAVAASANGTRFVSLAQPGQAADALLIPAIGPNTNDDEFEPLPIEVIPGPFPEGGFPGGGFSGGGGGFGGGAGGGGFGGGGGGGLLGLAGIALGAAALATNDDGFNANLASLIAP